MANWKDYVRIEKIISELKFDWEKKIKWSASQSWHVHAVATRTLHVVSRCFYKMQSHLRASVVPVLCKQCLCATSPCSYLATEHISVVSGEM